MTNNHKPPYRARFARAPHPNPYHYSLRSSQLGLACPFLHSDDPSEEAKRQVAFAKSASTASSTPSFTPSTPAASPAPAQIPRHADEVEWELGESSEPYFYGAPGTKIPSSSSSHSSSTHPSCPPAPCPRSAPPCIFFLRGNCRHGVACRFSHDAPPSSSPPPRSTPNNKSAPTSPSQVCSICLDETSTDKYGILQNCFHTFHYSCLKNWRVGGSSSISAVRSCPVCRAPSHFIIPYASPVTEEVKKKNLIAAYKLNCSKKECVTFKEKVRLDEERRTEGWVRLDEERKTSGAKRQKHIPPHYN